MESFETRSCITNITGCLFLRFVYPICSVPFHVAFVSLSLLALGISLFRVRLSYFRPSTAHEAPFAKDVGDMVCGLRNGPSDKTDNAAAASSVPSKRRLYFRTPQRVHWLLVVVRSCPFHTFWIQVSHRRKMKDSKRCVDLVYNATAAHRKHVADIFTNLRFVFSPGIKLASFG